MSLVLFSKSVFIIPNFWVFAFMINAEYWAGAFIDTYTGIPHCLSCVVIAELNLTVLYEYLVSFM